MDKVLISTILRTDYPGRPDWAYQPMTEKVYHWALENNVPDEVDTLFLGGREGEVPPEQIAVTAYFLHRQEQKEQR